MELTYLPVVSLLFFTCAAAQNCENGWTACKDDVCLKIFPTTLLTYEEAKSFCTSQGNGTSKGSLVMVKDADLQELLSNTTNDVFDRIWLGGKYDEQSAKFRWDDGQPLTYTNWQEGYPRNLTGADACIEMQPLNAQKKVQIGGGWADVTCQKHNLVMCQTSAEWTLKDAIAEILKMQQQIENAAIERNELRAELQVVSNRAVPVGSIYIEFYNQSSPETLWPTLSWEDISSTYAGLFFRASGGNSSSWGAAQEACAPRITQMNYSYLPHGEEFPDPLSIPKEGWSESGRAGYYYYQVGELSREGLSFYTESCEVRPQNQAVRIWKRIG